MSVRKHYSIMGRVLRDGDPCLFEQWSTGTTTGGGTTTYEKPPGEKKKKPQPDYRDPREPESPEERRKRIALEKHYARERRQAIGVKRAQQHFGRKQMKIRAKTQKAAGYRATQRYYQRMAKEEPEKEAKYLKKAEKLGKKAEKFKGKAAKKAASIKKFQQRYTELGRERKEAKRMLKTATRGFGGRGAYHRAMEKEVQSARKEGEAKGLKGKELESHMKKARLKGKLKGLYHAVTSERERAKLKLGHLKRKERFYGLRYHPIRKLTKSAKATGRDISRISRTSAPYAVKAASVGATATKGILRRAGNIGRLFTTPIGRRRKNEDLILDMVDRVLLEKRLTPAERKEYTKLVAKTSPWPGKTDLVRGGAYTVALPVPLSGLPVAVGLKHARLRKQARENVRERKHIRRSGRVGGVAALALIAKGMASEKKKRRRRDQDED